MDGQTATASKRDVRRHLKKGNEIKRKSKRVNKSEKQKRKRAKGPEID